MLGVREILVRNAASFLIVAVLVFWSSAGLAQVVDRTSLTNKVMCGYQGWFACPGDGNDPGVGWNHWSKASNNLGPGLYNTDIWPEMTEYDPSDRFLVPNTTLTSGGTPYLFSNCRQGAVNVHFRWMQENGIDGVYHQRFVGGYVGNPNDPWQRKLDTVLQNVMNAANTYGRTWALEYDISGVNTSDLYNKLTGDWTYLCGSFNIKNHARYLYHNNKPVVIIWGFGFSDRPGTPAIAQTIVDWFKADGCFVILGVPRSWRTDSNYSAVYRSCNGITPWTVGSYTNSSGINSYKSTAQADLSLCNSLGMVFMPTAWPRFGWDNMFGYSCGQSKISPRLGQHFWDQVYMYKSINVPCQFIAMFDEYDESTAIMKLADNVPTSGCWWTSEGKGSDWYLRLANQASRMQRGEIACSQTMPISSSTSPDNALIISHTIPSYMNLGDQCSVSVTVKNTGETTWCDPYWWALGAVGDSDPFAATRQPVAGTVVMPNQQCTFNITMTAPNTQGTYTTDWRMVHESVRWFGDTLTKSVVVGPDTTPPGAVTSFAAPSGDGQAILSWHNPSDSDFAGTIIRYKTGGFPTGVADGALVCNRSASPGSNDTFIHTGLANGTIYYYAAFTYDEVPNYSPVATASASPGVPPGQVISFAAMAGDTQNSLSWHNPGDVSFAGTTIRYGTDTYPASASHGMLACNKANTPNSNDSFVHTGLANGTIYYYAAFAYNGVPNYSTAATASAAPQGPPCFADGFAYPNGNLNGNGGWSGSATTQIAVESQTVKVSGGAGAVDSIHTLSCGSLGNPVGVWVNIKKGTGTSIFWNLWVDDSSGNNFGRWFGTGTTVRGRTGTLQTTTQTLTGNWDYLYVKIDFAAGMTQYFFNGASLGTHSHVGAGDTTGRIRFERTDSSGAAGQYLYFDDLAVGGADMNAPLPTVGPPSSAITRTGPVTYVVAFDEPVSGFNLSSDIQLNTTGGASATIAVTGSGPYTVTLSNITGGGTLGITAKASSCIDAAGNANTASAASATCQVIASDGSIAAAKQLADGTQVELGNKALYLKQGGFGYIEEIGRWNGIRVQGAIQASEGDSVTLAGTMQTTSGGERYIQLGTIAAGLSATTRPLAGSNRSDKSSRCDGLYVKTWGLVTGPVLANSFTINDGSDDSGIKVITQGAPGVTTGSFVVVEGAAGFDGARVIYRK